MTTFTIEVHDQAVRAALDALADEPQLVSYAYLASARADLLRRLGRHTEAAVAYRRALELTDNAVEAQFLRVRLAEAERGARPAS